MMHTQEWDWPPTRRPRRFFRRYRTQFDVYEPTGWNSPGVKKAINIYWRVMITAIKMLIAIPLTLMLIGSIWLLWGIVTL